jgi:hypothetical protein
MEFDLGFNPSPDRKEVVMDLVERYLAAIRRNLPAQRAGDIVAELADDVHSRREAREARLGRSMTDEETGAMLREFGHPLVIAARYRKYQHLIGPEVFPFYLFVMKVVLTVGAALLVGLGIVGLVLGDGNGVRTLAQVAGDLWSFFFLAVALVTLIFAILERKGFPEEHLRNWTPAQLPDPLDKPKSQWESAVEVGLGIAFLLWWTGVVTIPAIVVGDVVRIAAAPIWQDFYWPIVTIVAVQLAVNVMEWVRPRWKTAKSILTIGLCAATLAIVAGVYRAGSWVVVAPTARTNAEQAAKLTESVDLALQIALAVVALLMVFQALGEAWKLVRSRMVATPD